MSGSHCQIVRALGQSAHVDRCMGNGDLLERSRRKSGNAWQGPFLRPRLNNAAQFPIAAAMDSATCRTSTPTTTDNVEARGIASLRHVLQARPQRQRSTTRRISQVSAGEVMSVCPSRWRVNLQRKSLDGRPPPRLDDACARVTSTGRSIRGSGREGGRKAACRHPVVPVSDDAIRERNLAVGPLMA